MQSVMEYSSTTENTNTNGEPYTHHGSSEVVHEYGYMKEIKQYMKIIYMEVIK